MYLRSMPDAGALIAHCGELAAKGGFDVPAETVFKPEEVHVAFGFMKAGRGGKAVIDLSGVGAAVPFNRRFPHLSRTFGVGGASGG
jgi:hypothetical protein